MGDFSARLQRYTPSAVHSSSALSDSDSGFDSAGMRLRFPARTTSDKETSSSAAGAGSSQNNNNDLRVTQLPPGDTPSEVEEYQRRAVRKRQRRLLKEQVRLRPNKPVGRFFDVSDSEDEDPLLPPPKTFPLHLLMDVDLSMLEQVRNREERRKEESPHVRRRMPRNLRAFLRQFGHDNPLVASVEELILAHFSSVTAAGQQSEVLVVQSSSSWQRKFVHAVAAYYDLHSHSMDTEKQGRVTLIHGSFVPKTRIITTEVVTTEIMVQ
jgi:hypothetical protein